LFTIYNTSTAREGTHFYVSKHNTRSLTIWHDPSSCFLQTREPLRCRQDLQRLRDQQIHLREQLAHPIHVYICTIDDVYIQYVSIYIYIYVSVVTNIMMIKIHTHIYVTTFTVTHLNNEHSRPSKSEVQRQTDSPFQLGGFHESCSSDAHQRHSPNKGQ
jgi:hypothetical protein